MDELVRPDAAITDYVTRYSGITAEMMADVTTSLADVQVAPDARHLSMCFPVPVHAWIAYRRQLQQQGDACDFTDRNCITPAAESASVAKQPGWCCGDHVPRPTSKDRQSERFAAWRPAPSAT